MVAGMRRDICTDGFRVSPSQSLCRPTNPQCLRLYLLTKSSETFLRHLLIGTFRYRRDNDDFPLALSQRSTEVEENVPETQREMRPNAQFRVKLSCVHSLIPALASARLYCASGVSLIYHRKRAMLLLLRLLRLLSFFFRISGETKKKVTSKKTQVEN